MSTVKKGTLKPHPEMWKHLRKIGRRFFWKTQRTMEKKLIRQETGKQ